MSAPLRELLAVVGISSAVSYLWHRHRGGGLVLAWGLIILGLALLCAPGGP